MISFNREVTSDYEKAKRKEWLITNGIAGYASSTIIGCNTRGYHGLLIASVQPLMRRVLLLSKLEEKIVMDGREYQLSVNKYPGVLHPNGNLLLKEFSFETSPVFTYQVNETVIQKKVFMVYGENTTVVLYDVAVSPSPLTLHVYPLVNCRGHHHRGHKESLNFTHTYTENDFTVQADNEGPPLHVKSDRAHYSPVGVWYENFIYDLDAEMGLSDREDHYNPGVFTINLRKSERVLFTASDHSIKTLPSEIPSKATSPQPEAKDELIQHLLTAAQSFPVFKAPSKTIIAGYHWFGVWGRDTLISLPGLTLATKRYGDAAEILVHYSKHLKDGLLPEVFREDGGEPDYSSIDTSLWFFYALYKYLQYTNDWRLIQTLYSTMREIVRHYIKGTRFHIGMDKDSLIEGGDETTPLTWMDTVVDGEAVTLRRGKAVEVNALWYNALRIMEFFSKYFNLTEENEGYRRLARKAGESFNLAFWNNERSCLYDCVDGGIHDNSIRPNQILAIGLPYSVLLKGRWVSTMEAIQKDLLTPFGLRTLSPHDPKYMGQCIGDQRSRDRAYHQGTVWPWLLGFYITAYIRVNEGSLKAKQEATRLIEPFREHVRDAGLGSISEIFDGNPPHHSRGCISQAWSVAEIIRSAAEDLSIIHK